MTEDDVVIQTQLTEAAQRTRVRFRMGRPRTRGGLLRSPCGDGEDLGQIEGPLAGWPHRTINMAPRTSPAPEPSDEPDEPHEPAHDAVAMARNASELLYAYGAHGPYTDGVALTVIDSTSVLAVGYQRFQGPPSGGAELATGRVAWIRRDTWADGWAQERRMAGEGLSVGVGTKGVEYRFSVSVKLPDIDALLDLVAWLRADEITHNAP